jgi:HisJ family histidinol phosphate phosphatase
MINYDLHIHTEYCGHAPGMTIEAIIRAAEEKQLETIAITSHIFSEADLQLIPKIKNELARIKTDVNVIVGAEVDADGTRTDGKLIIDNLDDIDYVLGTIHYIPGTGIYPSSPTDNPLNGEEFFRVWQSTLIGVVSNSKIDTLAHPGRLAACSCDMDIYFDDMLAVFEKAAELSVKNNVCWGLNELNERKVPAAYHERWNEIYQVAIDAGVKLIYGSDAHKPQEVGKQTFVSKTIKAIGEQNLETPKSIGLI